MPHLDDYVTVDPSTHSILIEGANLQLVNGSGSTQGTTPTINGLGNLVIGYNEGATVRTGAHNHVIGRANNYSGAGGLHGFDNETSGAYAAVIAGQSSTASGNHAAIVGGSSCEAVGPWSSVFGAFAGGAAGSHATVVGGAFNNTEGSQSVIVGGLENFIGPLQTDSVVVGGWSTELDSASPWSNITYLGSESSSVAPAWTNAPASVP